MEENTNRQMKRKSDKPENEKKDKSIDRGSTDGQMKRQTDIHTRNNYTLGQMNAQSQRLINK